ncbi:replication-associated protein [Crucivirus-432]|nr:replication-associated protein [Crucivirus-432]
MSNSLINWCFTLNNYTEEEKNAIVGSADSMESPFKYIIFGYERGETGTPHLQGFFQLHNKRRLGGVKKLPGLARAHFEAARGSVESNKVYCSKEGDFFESGRAVLPRQRSDLSEVKDVLDAGGGIAAVARDYFPTFLRYDRAIEKYAGLVSKPRQWRTQVVWFWGATGSGKSFAAHKEAQGLSNGDYCVLADNSLKWFHPYAANRVVVLDDYSGEAPITLLLRLWDPYPMQVPIKGGFINWCPRIMYVTSNQSPLSVLHSAAQEHIKAACRRVDLIVNFRADGSQVVQTGKEHYLDRYPNDWYHGTIGDKS